MLSAATAQAFSAMQQAALAQGINIMPCSGYRSFERQLHIWNGKAAGTRPLLDANECPVDALSLSDDQLVETILLWSALPGASRHHWGTDVDVFDAQGISRADLQLVPSEYQAGGPCDALTHWLEQHAARFGFFLPYQAGQSGVSAEPWHLSYAPQAVAMLAHFNHDELYQRLKQSDLKLKAALLPRLEQIIATYVHHIAAPPQNLTIP
ncbi:M15 family metallopeptidase [Shewanella sp. NIFS-20-20]|nr:M15 family metallopeptidase [Shewanella sp. NIFS-20-20]MBV7317032.1 M15 family metallopeptidase [Shewanella sp. NIFS-20-20]